MSAVDVAGVAVLIGVACMVTAEEGHHHREQPQVVQVTTRPVVQHITEHVTSTPLLAGWPLVVAVAVAAVVILGSFAIWRR